MKRDWRYPNRADDLAKRPAHVIQTHWLTISASKRQFWLAQSQSQMFGGLFCFMSFERLNCQRREGDCSATAFGLGRFECCLAIRPFQGLVDSQSPGFQINV